MNGRDEEPTAAMVDLAFALEGRVLPREHRELLATALEAALPWLAETPGAGVHRLNLAHGAGAQALLSLRTKLVLRVPRERADDAAALVGATLDLGGHPLRVGALHARELLPWGTCMPMWWLPMPMWCPTRPPSCARWRASCASWAYPAARSAAAYSSSNRAACRATA